MEWPDLVTWSALVRESRILPRSFYAGDTEAVARGLVGKILVHERTAGRIVETEAYLGMGDLAAHASHGLTKRTRVIFGPPGHAYVYLIYGMYECLNLVAEPDGTPGCVLIRAIEPLFGPVTVLAAPGGDGDLKQLRVGNYPRMEQAHQAADRIAKFIKDRNVEPFVTRVR